MTLLLKLIVFGLAVLAVEGRYTPMNAEADARMQAHELLRCYEPIDTENLELGYKLSEAKFNFCMYMPRSRDYNSYIVSGVDDNSDDYTSVAKIFADAEGTHAILNLCLQEGFSLSGPMSAGEVTIRCLCKRNGCNLPASLTAFLDFNRNVVPVPYQ